MLTERKNDGSADKNKKKKNTPAPRRYGAALESGQNRDKTKKERKKK